MRTALIIYHVINLMHLIFYAYIFLQVQNYFYANFLRNDYIRIALFVYLGLVVLLRMIARYFGKGMSNPINEVKPAMYLHVGSIVLFVLSVILAARGKHEFIYLMIITLFMDVFAIVLAYRAFPITRDRERPLDDPGED